MKHARAWVAERYPGAPTLEAGKTLKRFPDPSRQGEWITQTVREDLFGCIDIAVFPQDSRVELIQVTSIPDSGDTKAVRYRKIKVADWIHDNFPERRPDWCGNVYVVGWVNRKHLRVWCYYWPGGGYIQGWVEQPPALAKLPKLARKTPPVPGPADLPGLAPSNPFD